jgi:hypothetical protein
MQLGQGYSYVKQHKTQGKEIKHKAQANNRNDQTPTQTTKLASKCARQ